MKNGASRVDFPYHLERVLQIVGFAKEVMAHASAGGIGNLAILHVISSGRKAIEIPRMVVMQMRQDHVRNFIRIDVEQPQRIDGTAQVLAFAPDGRFLSESRVDHEHAIASAHHPHKVVEIGAVFVRIGKDVALAWVSIS